ncbi:MAG: hypothetical protein OXC07_12050 [Kistimonas sp.]|nr:hypothetical protein [Kistimonas sp.]
MMPTPFHPNITASSAIPLAGAAARVAPRQMAWQVTQMSNTPTTTLPVYIKQLIDKIARVESQRHSYLEDKNRYLIEEQRLQSLRASLELQAHLARQDSEFLPRAEERERSKIEHEDCSRKVHVVGELQVHTRNRVLMLQQDIETTERQISTIAAVLNNHAQFGYRPAPAAN